MNYLNVWATSKYNEPRIVNATLKMLSEDMRIKRACGIKVMDPRKMLTNYEGCVSSVVNLAYRELWVADEVLTDNPLNTKKVTKNVRSYLKSVLAAKYQCAPKG